MRLAMQGLHCPHGRLRLAETYAVRVEQGAGLMTPSHCCAAAARALCVQRAGAMPSLPHRDEVVRLIKEQGT